MAKITKKEKKLAKKTLRTIEDSKKRELLMSQDPKLTYKREIIHSDMPWPLKLISMGRKDILMLIIVAIIILIVIAGFGLYYVITWIIEALEGVL